MDLEEYFIAGQYKYCHITALVNTHLFAKISEQWYYFVQCVNSVEFDVQSSDQRYYYLKPVTV